MQNSRVASRYAKSLIDLAIEKGQLEVVYNDALYLQSLTKQSREFVAMLRSPVVNADAKRKVLEALTAGKVGDLTKAFINLMINKTREGALPEIMGAVISQYKDYKGIHIVKLTTATPLTNSARNAIVEKVKATANIQNLELEEAVDPTIIGGFVLQTGDKLIDASVAYDLKNISREFENNDFIYKLH